MPSRAPSTRSVRSVNTLGRAPSIAPTLPDGAERMLEGLRPEGADDDEYEEDDIDTPEPTRPQFVLGTADAEGSDAKPSVEHHEHQSQDPYQGMTAEEREAAEAAEDAAMDAHARAHAEHVHAHDHEHDHASGLPPPVQAPADAYRGWKEV